MLPQRDLAAAQAPDSQVAAGRKNAYARKNQMMPGDWTHLGPGDLERITAAVRRRVGPRSTLETLEGCLMVQAILTTGRRFNQLHGLGVVRARLQGAVLTDIDQGLILRDRAWSWWLRAGQVKAAKARKPELMKPLTQNVWFPISRNTHAVLSHCINKRGGLAYRNDYTLFQTSAPQLRAEIQDILSEAMGLAKARRSATTIESAERWLFRALTHEPGGDPAAAALITGRDYSVARPMTYYGALPIERAVSLHKSTVKRVDEHSDAECPGELVRLSIGDARTPKDGAVRSLSSELGRRLTNAGDNVIEIHAAMSDYTIALLAFALALRGVGRVPGHRGIDAETGFAFVHDKYLDRADKARLVWVCDIARKQLREYELHLDGLARVLSAEAQRELVYIRAAANDTFACFALRRGLRLQRWRIDEARAWRHAAWPGKKNAGRHWLRSKLAEMCASETIAAFLGHWQWGVHPWSPTAALDPLLYRADLHRAFDGLLESVGWQVRSSPLGLGGSAR